MMFDFKQKRYDIKITSRFKKCYKKIKKQGKDISKLIEVLKILSMGENLPIKYNNHKLIDDKKYSECFECHIEPDWLLIYEIKNDELVLLLFETGSHSELFNK